MRLRIGVSGGASLSILVSLTIVFSHFFAPTLSYVGSRNATDADHYESVRKGKFLFDSLFGIEDTAASLEEDETEPNTLKSCDCGT